MGRLDELISAEFARWEQRGRGWQVWPEPVQPEPPFEEFTGYRLAEANLEVDDGRRPGMLASFFDSIERRLNPPRIVEREEHGEPEPLAGESPLTAEFVASLPTKLDVRGEAFRAFLDSLHACSEPTAFELLADHEHVTLQFVTSPGDASVLQRQLTAFLPQLAFTQAQDGLVDAWNGNDGVGFIVEFGLAHEFMLPLATSHAVDPFVGLVSALSGLQPGETAVFQVLFQPVRNPWPGSVWRSVTDAQGKALFVNRLQILSGTKAKLESPLFGAVVRTAVKAESFERAVEVVRHMAESLRTFTRPEGNRLIPLTNKAYDHEAHEADLTERRSRRSGMLLNRDELLGFVHLPADEVRAAKLRRERTRTKAAPAVALGGSLVLGENRHQGRSVAASLSPDQRTRHMHVIGATSTGKSTLLFNLIQQDIENGEGIAVLDPHGDLIERILGVIPPERIGDVVLIDPADEQFSVGFNILSAHSDLEKTLLASDLVSVFQRLSTSWGDQLGSVLNNAILAFLESSEGGTLADLRRFLIEPAYRDRFLKTVRDPDIVYYWRKAFAQLSGNKSIGPVLTRLDTFLSPKPIRYMVSQPVNRLDFADILDSGKIFLAKLSQGQMGKENSFLLGSLLMAKFQQAAMARQRQAAASRRDFWLYVDEFHNFITPSMAEILSGARKYRLGLILAHQELRQLERDREVASAVLSNPYTRVVFRVGDDDARKLEGGFSFFEARDFQNLEIGNAVCRVEKADGDFNLTVPLPLDPDPDLARTRREEVIAASRRRYATPRTEIEAALLAKLDAEEPAPPKPSAVRKVAEPTAIPKAAEVPKATGPEKQTAPVVEPPEPQAPPASAVAPDATPAPSSAAEVVPAQPDKTKPPTDSGRGGEQHKAIQKRLKEAAEKLGYRVTAEQPVLDNTGSVDLALSSPRRTIAVEVTVTTTIDHEVGNVLKCLRAEFQTVAVVSGSETKLRQMQEAVIAALGPELSARVGYFTPDQLITYLEAFAQEDAKAAPSPPAETVRLGYKVKRSAPKLTAEELKAKEEAALKMLSETMKKKPPGQGG